MFINAVMFFISYRLLELNGVMITTKTSLNLFDIKNFLKMVFNSLNDALRQAPAVFKSVFQQMFVLN